MGNQSSRHRVDSRLDDLSGVRKFSSFTYSDTRLTNVRKSKKESDEDRGVIYQVSEETLTDCSEFEQAPGSSEGKGDEEKTTELSEQLTDTKLSQQLTDSKLSDQLSEFRTEKDLKKENLITAMTPEEKTGYIVSENENNEAVGDSAVLNKVLESNEPNKGALHQNPSEKKQVSIVDSNPSPTRRRRSKFERQDTPIHPDIITLKPIKRPNILKSLSDQNSITGNSLPVSPVCCRSSSVDTRVQIVPPPPPLGSSQANRLRNTTNLNTSNSITSNSSATSPPSFVCSVDFADSPAQSPTQPQDQEDEFAIFVKASIHPPNELSVPRCYPEPPSSRGSGDNNSGGSQKKYNRSKSVSSPHSSTRSLNNQKSLANSTTYNFGSNQSGSRPSSPRPRLQRESAQEIEDGEYPPGFNMEVGVYDRAKSPHPPTGKCVSLVPGSSPHLQQRLPLHRSAPGTPSTQGGGPRMSRSPSRTPSDETYLKVPYIRTRGTSLPESMEDTLTSDLYLLRQFNIRGKKVVHLGDSYQSRARSNSSVNSAYSGHSWGHSQNSSFSRPGSGRSSMDNYSSTEDDPMSHFSGVSMDNQLQSYRVIMLGSGGVGKSSLVHKFLSGNYSNFSNHIENYENDRGDKSVVVQLEDIECELIFIDKPRSEISTENLLSTYRGDCAVIVFSVTEEDSLHEAGEILNILWQSGNLNSQAAIVVGNKTDLVRTRTVAIDKARAMASSHDCKYCEVSAALDHNVDSLLVGIVKQIHLKIQSQQKRNRHNNLYTRRKSAGVRMRGIIDKVMGTEVKSKSCDDLYVL